MQGRGSRPLNPSQTMVVELLSKFDGLPTENDHLYTPRVVANCYIQGPSMATHESFPHVRDDGIQSVHGTAFESGEQPASSTNILSVVWISMWQSLVTPVCYSERERETNGICIHQNKALGSKSIFLLLARSTLLQSYIDIVWGYTWLYQSYSYTLSRWW